jgi:hypothetical protein
MFSLRATWGIWPQCEFNVTQSTLDRIILEAIQLFFNSVGSINNRTLGVSSYAVRNYNDLLNVIIPFFTTYPLLTLKSIHFQTWKSILDILGLKLHFGQTLEARDNLLKIAHLMVKLNDSRSNTLKIRRMKIIITWLESLDSVPTLAQKEELKNLLDNERKSS